MFAPYNVPIVISPPTINSRHHSLSNSSPNPIDPSSTQHSSDTLSSDEQPADDHEETEHTDSWLFFLFLSALYYHKLKIT